MKQLYNFKNLFLATLLSVVSTLSFAQILSYTVDSIPFKWEDFSTYDQTTELIALAGEDEVYPLVLPFDFEFFENTYTEVFASVNGNVSFGQSYQGIDFNRENLCQPVSSLYNPSGGQYSGNPDNFIAVYWDDLFIDPTCDGLAAGTPKFVYRTIGTTPNREFIVGWEYFYNSGNLPCAAFGLPDGFISVQLRLFETSNLIEVHILENGHDEKKGTIAVENINGDYAAYARCGNHGSDLTNKAFSFTPSLLPPPVDTTGEVTYCDASGPKCDNSDGTVLAITEVSLEGDGTSGFTNTTGCDSYGDFSSEFFAFMTVGNPYVFTLTGEGFDPDPTLFEFTDGRAGVFVDWNEDGDFEDAQELITVGPTVNDLTTQTFTTVITPPATATNGIKRMRVRLKAGYLSEDLPRPCSFQDGGEVEDYSIVVGNPPPCVSQDLPIDGAINQCQSTLLQWSGDSTNIDGYYVYLGQTGSPLVKVDSIGDKSIQEYLATNLMVNTSYDWLIVPFSTEGNAILCDTSTFTTGANQDPTVQITIDGVGAATSVVEVCNLVDVNLSGIATQGTFAGNINTASWTGDVSNLNVDNTLDVVFVGDTLGKLYFYTLNIEDDNGCSASHSVALHTNEAEAGTIQRNTDFVCDGDSTLLYVTGNSDNVIDWEFSPNDTNFVTMSIAGDSIFAGNLLQNTYYRAIVQDAIGCTDTTESILLVYQPKPAALVISQQTDTLFAMPNTGNISWFKIGNPDVEVANGAFYVPAREPADFYAVETNGLGCVSNPSNIITYDWQVGIGENNAFSTSFKLYPNPSNGIVTVLGEIDNNSTLILFDLTGRVVMDVELQKGSINTINLTNKTGVYFVKIYGDNKLVHQQQVIIQ